MARKSITDYFPTDDPPVFVGGYVPRSKRARARAILNAKGLVYADLLRAAFTMLIDQSSGSILKIAEAESKYDRRKK